MKHYLATLLQKHHRCAGFECGQKSLDIYLQKAAPIEVKRSLEACFVWTPGSDREVNGYYTLTNSRIAYALIPKDLRRKLPRSFTSIPVTMMSRLAVHQNVQHQGWGSLLLIDALKRSFETSKTIGSFAVIVDPMDANTEAFYKNFGFINLADSGKMFLVMKTLKQLFDSELNSFNSKTSRSF